MKDISIIVPIYNEAGNLEELFRRIYSVVNDLKLSYEIIAVDDGSTDETRTVLNQFKDRQLFLIDVKHLLEPHAGLKSFSLAVTDLAELIIDEATRICYEHLGGSPGSFTVCGLGKFGGREMGYASDLELLFIQDGSDRTEFFESLAHHVVEFIEVQIINGSRHFYKLPLNPNIAQYLVQLPF